MNENLFKGSDHSSLYKRFRPSPPSQLTSYLNGLIKTSSPPKCAIDVGCGSGQCTELLSPLFGNVIGFDVSGTQIKEATTNNKLENVKYQVSPAESIPLSDSSVDLITCCQAFHWFDGPQFLTEASRLLKKGGVLALIAQEVPNVQKDGASDEIAGICKRFRDEFKLGKLNAFWKSEANRIENGYDDVVLPFDTVIRKSFVHSVPGTGYDVIGFLESWSCVQTMKRDNPTLAQEVFNSVRAELASCCKVDIADVDKTEMALVYDYGVLIGRK